MSNTPDVNKETLDEEEREVLEEDEEDPFNKRIENSGCAEQHYKLQVSLKQISLICCGPEFLGACLNLSNEYRVRNSVCTKCFTKFKMFENDSVKYTIFSTY